MTKLEILKNYKEIIKEIQKNPTPDSYFEEESKKSDARQILRNKFNNSIRGRYDHTYYDRKWN